MSLSDTYRRDIARLLDKEASLRKLQRHESDAAKAMETHTDRRRQPFAHRQHRAAIAISTPPSERARKHWMPAARQRIPERSSRTTRGIKRTRSVAWSLLKNHTAKPPTARATAGGEKRRTTPEIARLSAPQVHYVHIRPPEPERLRVLYLTANPGMDLRTDWRSVRSSRL